MGMSICLVLYIIPYKKYNNQHKLYQSNQQKMDCEWPLGMIHFSLILNHNVGIKYADEPFHMGMLLLPKASFNMGTFSYPQHTHPGIFILESLPLEKLCQCLHELEQKPSPNVSFAIPHLLELGTDGECRKSSIQLKFAQFWNFLLYCPSRQMEMFMLVS